MADQRKLTVRLLPQIEKNALLRVISSDISLTLISVNMFVRRMDLDVRQTIFQRIYVQPPYVEKNALLRFVFFDIFIDRISVNKLCFEGNGRKECLTVHGFKCKAKKFEVTIRGIHKAYSNKNKNCYNIVFLCIFPFYSNS